MKKAVFTDFEMLSRHKRQLEIENEALRSELKVFRDENNELIEASR